MSGKRALIGVGLCVGLGACAPAPAGGGAHAGYRAQQLRIDPDTRVIAVRSPRPGLRSPVWALNTAVLVEDQLLQYTNNLRIRRGLPALVHVPALSRVARAHSRAMTLSYDQEKTLESRLQDAGIAYAQLGRNIIAMGDRPEPAWALMFEGTVGLARNPAQYANLVNTEFTQVGVGVYHSSDNQTYYVTQIFIKPEAAAEVH